ncbi:unnamed protein product [Symbiodinium pilosum]|uniref:Uncharacterized protein n=1 Tax=Symbiodinium pilosum TaxID=2952 RepID=A0A812SBC2_SYMPI|nr:unnamed protein product [Symbiodinium pilosum]
MDPSLKCPACKDNLGVRAWNLPCGQLSHAIHVKDTQHVSGNVDMHFWFDNMPADLFGYQGESEIAGTVRQCRYNPTTGGPINGPFHNARVEVRVWTQVPHGRREHSPAQHQFLVDDFLLTDPSLMCPRCRWILNSLRVLHNRHDGYGGYQKGIIFSFDSGIAIPHTGHGTGEAVPLQEQGTPLSQHPEVGKDMERTRSPDPTWTWKPSWHESLWSWRRPGGPRGVPRVGGPA